LRPVAGSRQTRDGRLLRWSLAGVEDAAAESSLPFFIEWGRGTSLPCRAAVDHPAGDVRIARLVLSGAEARLTEWIGPHEMPVEIRPGDPAVVAVQLSGDAGEFALDPEKL
jgi:Glyoxalase-like domain